MRPIAVHIHPHHAVPVARVPRRDGARRLDIRVLHLKVALQQQRACPGRCTPEKGSPTEDDESGINEPACSFRAPFRRDLKAFVLLRLKTVVARTTIRGVPHVCVALRVLEVIGLDVARPAPYQIQLVLELQRHMA